MVFYGLIHGFCLKTWVFHRFSSCFIAFLWVIHDFSSKTSPGAPGDPPGIPIEAMVLVDENTWVKAGIEYCDAVPRLSCVVTNEGFTEPRDNAERKRNGFVEEGRHDFLWMFSCSVSCV